MDRRLQQTLREGQYANDQRTQDKCSVSLVLGGRGKAGKEEEEEKSY